MIEINKINPKPIETVYEIKNEYKVPSFEEFMKDYKVDEKVNYEDLSGGSVGEVGGYGPCSYGNPDCTCYTSDNWIQLYVGCLADGCPNHKSPFSWVHASCGKPIYISTNL